MLDELSALLPAKIRLQPDKSFRWSPANKTLYYKPSQMKSAKGQWSLLHEAGHALLNHKSYTFDVELLIMESQAWQTAQQLATKLDITIDEDHIQDCLDSYRSWLHWRSKCPVCDVNGLQQTAQIYYCVNCSERWQVSESRFSRAYRRSLTNKKLPALNR